MPEKKITVKYSDFFGCHFVIYHDPETGKCLTQRCYSEEEVESFKESLMKDKPLWYNDERF